MVTYFDSIDLRLSDYEQYLEGAPMLLEIAIWKSKITELFDRNNDTLTIDMKMQCRTDSVTVVDIIVPYFLSFLFDGDEGADIVGSVLLMLLELAIWKSKIMNQFSQNAADMRLQSRADSLSMVLVIVRNVLSFLYLMVMMATCLGLWRSSWGQEQ
jgi:hypothetical protein